MTKQMDNDLLLAALAARTDVIDGTILQESMDAANQGEQSLLVHLAKSGVDQSTLDALQELTQRHVESRDGDVRASLNDLLRDQESTSSLAVVRQIEQTTHQHDRSGPNPDQTDVMKDPTKVANRLESSGGNSRSDMSENAFGRFAPIEFLARGGIGEIFRARDTELGRTVALKCIQRRHSKDRFFQERFVLEAEVTGSLEHPNIVPVYGLGSDNNGVPYYAMRLIEGESLAHHISLLYERPSVDEEDDAETILAKKNSGDTKVDDQNHRLVPQSTIAVDRAEFDSNLKRLLNRFVSVCRAIHYANSRGVLHRDIKPDNIMLGAYGETLVLDWGLAKLINEETKDSVSGGSSVRKDQMEAVADSTATTDGALIGTLAFMSPEQSLGWHDTLTPASDVYSLGATLYAMLTGDRAIHGSDLNELLLCLQSGTIVSPRQRNRFVHPALDAICLKAMNTKPSLRYQSAKELADDIESFLADEPIEVWKDNLGSRIGRWTRKNPSMTSGSVVGVLMLVVAMTIGLWFVNSARREESRLRAEAIQERDRADGFYQLADQAIQSYITIVSEDDELAREGLSNLRERLLRTAIPFLEEIARQEDDADVGLPTARAHSRLGLISQTVGDFEEARKQFETAIEQLEPLHQSDPDNHEVSIELAKAIGRLAIETSRMFEYEKTDELLARVDDILVRASQTEEYELEVERLIAMMWNNHSVTLRDREDLGGAEDGFLKAIEHYGRIEQELSPESSDVRRLVGAYGNLSLVYADRGESTERMEAIDVGLEIVERWNEECKDDPFFLLAYSDLCSKQAEAFFDAGEYDSSIDAYRLSIELVDPLLVSHVDDLDFQSHVALIESNWSVVFFTIGEYGEAVERLESCAARRRRRHAAYPTDHENLDRLASCLMNHASICYEQDNYERAEELIKEAIGFHRELRSQFEENHLIVSSLVVELQTLARIVQAQDRMPEAIEILLEAIDLIEEVHQAHQERVEYQAELAVCLSDLGDFYIENGDMDDAQASLQRALNLQSDLVDRERSSMKVRVQLESTRLRIALLDFEREDLDQALDGFMTAADSLEEIDRDHPGNDDVRNLLVTALQNVSVIHAFNEDFAMAAQWRERSLDFTAEPIASDAYLMIAETWVMGDRPDKGMSILEERSELIIADGNELSYASSVAAQVYKASMASEDDDTDELKLRRDRAADMVAVFFEIYANDNAFNRAAVQGFMEQDELYSLVVETPQVQAMLERLP